MAKRVSRRKRPSKEKFQLKERFKIESSVFDRNTLLGLSKLLKKGIIETVDYCISTGKEANVFRATAPGGDYVAVKIYRVETTQFLKRRKYLIGDPRFEKIKHTPRDIVKAFARKEYKNLEICDRAGVHAPKPYYLLDNIIVMEFLGEGDLPYPTMDMVGPLHGERDLESILEDLRRMNRAGLVHADVSEYNIMLGDVPYFIDWGQGVVKEHPNAGKFLERDVKIILKYFRKHDIRKDLEDVLKWIRGD
jgi:RIO kinase 1